MGKITIKKKRCIRSHQEGCRVLNRIGVFIKTEMRINCVHQGKNGFAIHRSDALTALILTAVQAQKNLIIVGDRPVMNANDITDADWMIIGVIIRAAFCRAAGVSYNNPGAGMHLFFYKIKIGARFNKLSGSNRRFFNIIGTIAMQH